MSPSRLPRALWWLIGSAFLLRAAALVVTVGTHCFQDECSYVLLATALAQGRGFLPRSKHFWPPGYIFFLAAHLTAFGSVLAAKVTQVFLSTALVPLVYALGARTVRSIGPVVTPPLSKTGKTGSGTVSEMETVPDPVSRPREGEAAERVGLLAAALVAFDPTLIAYAHYYFSETLFLPLFTGALIAVLACTGTSSVRKAAAAGLLLGLACLVKVVPLYLSPFLAAAIWFRSQAPARLRLRATVALLATLVAVLTPWTLRNALAYHRFVLLETTTGENLVRGNSAYPPANWDWGSRRVTPALDEAACAQKNPVDLDHCLQQRGIDAIVGHPGRFLAQGATKIADLVNPTSFLVRHLRIGLYGPVPSWLLDVLVVPIALFAAGTMAAAAAGWILAPPSAARLMAGTTVAYTIVLHTVTFGMSRFRLPLVPLLAVGVALALAGVRSRPTDARCRARAWLLAGILAVLLACWSVRVAGLFHRAEAADLPPSLDIERPEPGG